MVYVIDLSIVELKQACVNKRDPYTHPLDRTNAVGASRPHYSGVMMGAMASQIISLAIVYSTVYSKKASKLRVLAFCAGNSPVPGEFPAQMASNVKNVSILWRHHATRNHFTNIYWLQSQHGLVITFIKCGVGLLNIFSRTPTV